MTVGELLQELENLPLHAKVAVGIWNEDVEQRILHSIKKVEKVYMMRELFVAIVGEEN